MPPFGLTWFAPHCRSIAYSGRPPCWATELVTHGVFAFVRNPIFTGMGVLLAGQQLTVPSVLSAAAFAVFAAAVQVQVRLIEEPYLLRTHGADYRSYASRTGRFVPLAGRLR